MTEQQILDEYKKVCGSIEYFKTHYLGVFPQEENPNQLKLDLNVE